MGKFSIESVIEEFEALTVDAVEVQKQTLQRILEENAEAEYLRNLGLDSRTDVESFRSCVPLVTHGDVEPYIQRIVDGDSSPVLTGKPIPRISLSSGTTQGKQKFIPFNEELVKNTMQIFTTSYAFRNRDFPIGMGKALQFLYSSKQFTTKEGITVTTATTHVYSSDQFKTTMKEIQSQCSSPDEVIFTSDFRQSLYCHFLCGLIFADDIQFLFSAFAHSLVQAFRAFEEFYEEICSDIRQGVLSTRITIPSMRAAVSELLHPNPELADEIYMKCNGLDNWCGVIPMLWPNAKYVYGIMTGSMEPYMKKLRHYAGELPLVSADYGASEGWLAVNVIPKSPPETASFAVLPNIGFYEFIPLVDQEKGSQENGEQTELEPVGLGDVKVGEEYELILTNFAGLYRYRLGDVVKIVGFYNSTPLLKFVCRKSLLLNINIDKNTEKDLQLAVEEAGELVASEKLEVLDFTSHVDFSTEPAHYVVFWELSGDAADDVLQNCTDTMDRAFVDAGYVTSRIVSSIGPLELRVLRKGTFQKLLEHFLGMGAAVSQFKTPRCVGANNTRVLQILNDNIVAKYFSSAFG